MLGNKLSPNFSTRHLFSRDDFAVDCPLDHSFIVSGSWYCWSRRWWYSGGALVSGEGGQGGRWGQVGEKRRRAANFIECFAPAKFGNGVELVRLEWSRKLRAGAQRIRGPATRLASVLLWCLPPLTPIRKNESLFILRVKRQHYFGPTYSNLYHWDYGRKLSTVKPLCNVSPYNIRFSRPQGRFQPLSNGFC